MRKQKEIGKGRSKDEDKRREMGEEKWKENNKIMFILLLI